MKVKKAAFLAVWILVAILLYGCMNDTSTTTVPSSSSTSETTSYDSSTTSSTAETTDTTTTAGTGFETSTTISTTESSSTTNFTSAELIPVYFNSQCEIVIDTWMGEAGNTVPYMNVNRDGYTLTGWYVSYDYGVSIERYWDFTNDVVAGDSVSLYADWSVNYYAFTYEYNDGSLPYTEYYPYGTEFYNLVVPSRDGYVFDGWFFDSGLTEETDSVVMPAHDVTLYAKWEEIVDYTISYVLNGGSNNIYNPTTYNALSDDILLLAPTKDGNTFAGWYDNENFTGDDISVILFGSSGNITLYAKWQTNTYTLTYNIYDDYDSIAKTYLADNETIVLLEANGSSVICATSSGRILTWGWICSDDGTFISQKVPLDITYRFPFHNGETIVKFNIDANRYAITSEGRLFAWGTNFYGELGTGDNFDRFVPTDITSMLGLNFGETVVDVATASRYNSTSARIEYSTVVLTSGHRVLTWGMNTWGQLGDGTSTDRMTPSDITANFTLDTGEYITMIAASNARGAAVTSNGRLFVWGNNENNYLGTREYYYDEYGTLPVCLDKGYDMEDEFYNMDPSEKFISVTMGKNHMGVVTSDGRVFLWGDNSYGQIGDATTTVKIVPTDITSRFGFAADETIVELSLGGNHSVLLTSSGRYFVWGNNADGQVGNNATGYITAPNEFSYVFGLPTGVKIVDIDAGFRYSIIIASDGSILATGNNAYGQIGNNSTSTCYVPDSPIMNILFSSESFQYLYDETIAAYIPERESYTIDGWYQDLEMSVSYICGNMPSSDLILFGIWIPS